MKFVANAHVRITGARLTQVIEAPNARKADAIGQEWAHENDLTYDGIETQEEHRVRNPKLPLFDSGDPALGEEISKLFGEQS